MISDLGNRYDSVCGGGLSGENVVCGRWMLRCIAGSSIMDSLGGSCG